MTPDSFISELKRRSMMQALLDDSCFGCGGKRVGGTSSYYCHLCTKYKLRSQSKVSRAIRSGDIPRVRGSGVKCSRCLKRDADAYDHRNYGRPLDVNAVCYSCNSQLGPGAIPDDVAEAHRNLNKETAK